MENTRKRMQKEKEEATRFAVENVMSDILAPIDNLENALKFTDQMSDETRNWALGFQMILGQFKEALHEQGVVPSNRRNPLQSPSARCYRDGRDRRGPSRDHPGRVCHGYKCGDRTCVPPRVKVAESPVKKHKIRSKTMQTRRKKEESSGLTSVRPIRACAIMEGGSPWLSLTRKERAQLLLSSPIKE